ncbi:MAG TPA: hypothetical protein VG164_13155 [Trebonia sp.]|nr:hypothetical protein [Trebonia sp.]
MAVTGTVGVGKARIAIRVATRRRRHGAGARGDGPRHQQAAARVAGRGADRAVRTVPGFSVDAGNRADVIRLCRRLGGIPLAMELAAARLRALTVRQLTAELGDLRLLAGSRRTTEARHQRLAAAIEWGRELCTPAERRLWDRLSVFAGGFEADAAAEVCADAALPPADIPAALAGLVTKPW